MEFETVIGLEVHARLLTKTKLFCADANDFGDEPNANVSAVSLAHPGTLPVLNEKAAELAVRLGLALNCRINRRNVFARKNYFYPDLPKGYQTSQHTEPICIGGEVTIFSGTCSPLPEGEGSGVRSRAVRLDHIHLEEDAGKSIHDMFDDKTAIDLNRAGTPLLEIVSQPDMHSAEEAMAYLTELRRLLRWLNICDGNMEEGSLRCDANVSLRLKGTSTLGTRVEVKNLNSIRHLGKAIRIEEERLAKILAAGETVMQQTRGYDAHTNTTSALRSKEEAADYRYFPDPDIPPVVITDEFINAIRLEMPELPAQFEQRLISDYKLAAADAALIAADKQDAAYYSDIIASGIEPLTAAKKFIHQLRKASASTDNAERSYPITPAQFAAYIRFVDSHQVNEALFEKMLAFPDADPAELAERFDLMQRGESNEMDDWIGEAIASMPDKLKEFKSGKKGLTALFAGKVKQISKGKADMKAVMPMLEKRLSEL